MTRIAVVDDVVLVRWREMDLPSIAAVDEAVKKAHAAKGAVTYIGMINNESGMPDETARARLGEGLNAMQSLCSSVNLVLDGTGLKFVAIRSAAAALFLVKGSRQMRMYDSLEACLKERLPARADAVLAAARAQQLVA